MPVPICDLAANFLIGCFVLFCCFSSEYSCIKAFLHSLFNNTTFYALEPLTDVTGAFTGVTGALTDVTGTLIGLTYALIGITVALTDVTDALTELTGQFGCIPANEMGVFFAEVLAKTPNTGCMCKNLFNKPLIIDGSK